MDKLCILITRELIAKLFEVTLGHSLIIEDIPLFLADVWFFYKTKQSRDGFIHYYYFLFPCIIINHFFLEFLIYLLCITEMILCFLVVGLFGSIFYFFLMNICHSFFY